MKRLLLVRPLGFATFLLLACFALSGCGFDTHQSAMQPRGPVARMQYDAFMVTIWVTGFLFLTVGGALGWAVWRYRSRPGDENKPLPKQSHGSALVEVGLIIASAVMLVFVAVPTLQGIMFMHDLPSENGTDAVQVRVTGYQWWWQFEYLDEGLITANEMVIPVGKPVQLELIGGDVNHSFWLPRLAGKTDLIPGQTNNMWIQADEPGMYWGQCAEFCGDSHAFMLFRVRAIPQEEYDTWLAQTLAEDNLEADEAPVETARQNDSAPDQERLAAIERGHQLFLQNCATCHRVQPRAAGVAPNLHNIAARSTIAAGWMENNYENLHEWIQHSEEVKPGNLMYNGLAGMVGLKDRQEILTDDNVDAIIAYLDTLD